MRKSDREVFDEISKLITEERNPQTTDIDKRSPREILEIINSQDEKVAPAVKKEIPRIEKAVKLIVDSLSTGGRLIYVGAGTSGRLGVLDAAECPPTFGTPPKMVQGVIAGGYRALVKSKEGAEDDQAAAMAEMDRRKVGPKDTVVGIAASRRTPFARAALERARERGARTVLVTANPELKDDVSVDVAICPLVGPEVIMGSTRMKAGTAQKMVLNMITTTSMILLGKVYENMMVDLGSTSRKLRERGKRVIMTLTGADYDTASRLLRQAKGNVKAAIVMKKTSLPYKDAMKRLKEKGGLVRWAIEGE